MPPATKHERHFAVAAEVAAVETIQSEVDDTAHAFLDHAALFRLKMSIEELVTNIVSHNEAASEPIHVSIMVDPEWVSVEISDAGIAFDPFNDAPAPQLDASVENRRVGGLGIHLVERLVDKVGYLRSGGRNHVSISMRRHEVTTDGEPS